MLLSTVVSAKCEGEFHAISGVVADGMGKPIPGAHVRATWTEWRRTASGSAVADGQGRYRLQIQFNPFSGEGPNGDACQGRLAGVSLVANAPGFLQSSTTLPDLSQPMLVNLSLRKQSKSRKER